MHKNAKSCKMQYLQGLRRMRSRSGQAGKSTKRKNQVPPYVPPERTGLLPAGYLGLRSVALGINHGLHLGRPATKQFANQFVQSILAFLRL
jgi:hypothetical protein